MAVQSEPVFSSWWLEGRSFGDRAGLEQPLDIAIAIVGLVLIFEAARRTVGWALPILAVAFLLYGFFGASLPSGCCRTAATGSSDWRRRPSSIARASSASRCG